MTAAKVMDTISRLPSMSGDTNDAVSEYTQVKMSDASKLHKLPETESAQAMKHRASTDCKGKKIRRSLVTRRLGDSTRLGQKLQWSKRGRSYKTASVEYVKVNVKQDVNNEARGNNRKVHITALMALCHLKHGELAEHLRTCEGRVGFARRQASASHVTAAQVLDTFSWLLGMSGEVQDAVFAYTQVKMSDAPRLLKRRSGSGHLATVVRNIGVPSMTQWSHWSIGLLWGRRLEDVCWKMVERKYPVGHVLVFTDKLNSSYQFTSTT